MHESVSIWGSRPCPWSKPGDKISALGFYEKAGVCEMVDTVEIALSNPLAPPGSRPRRPRPAANDSDTARRPEAKAKPGAKAVAGKGPAATGPQATEKAPAEVSEGVDDPFKDQPVEKDNPPAETGSAPPNDVTPPAEETRPEPKKPGEKGEKKPPADDDDNKNVFDK